MKLQRLGTVGVSISTLAAAILKLPNVIVALVSTVGTETTSADTAKLNVPILKFIAGTITSGWSISVLATAILKLPIANV